MNHLKQLIGLPLVLVAILTFFSVMTSHFATAGNINAMLHAMAPLVIMSCGMALVVFSGKLDISIGSIAFLSATLAVLLINDHAVPPILAFLASLVAGIVLGALNGFIVVVLGVNALIATLGTMIALRGIALSLTGAVLIPLPTQVARLGNLTIGPLFADIVVLVLVVIAAHIVHRHTVFGRRLNAIGNGEDAARRIGLPVDRTVFASFVLSGFLAALGGIVALLQVGAISAYLGRGMEFTAVAVVVVGGISLFGGRGAILPGILLGAFIFEAIANGLNQMSANPYAYQLITGLIIFLAMYVDAMQHRRKAAVRTRR
ncbi:ABC transporter permease [Shinella oryzae]|uniref:Autoinducer 2 import system permease protein LsrD n=1 Tax=Shinella oryzae TaxID=2871820 RepID=A0ABY9KCZ7_9HYPH|nr:ABC transporter permease [Shinella oryzae]MDP9588847.1 ribose/xylose/arabinose/galactoside ABC-type transport system permease subunit [Shinella zoogloeoides]WLS04772.1 ABC transporter permease [Shinella oryzae]